MKKAIAIILSMILILALTIPATAISKIDVKGLALNNKVLYLKVGQYSNLVVSFTPKNTSQKQMTYVTDNVKIAKVDEVGRVTAISKGTTTITVYSASNNKIFTKCKVTVFMSKEQVKLNLVIWGDEARKKIFEGYSARFNQKNPNMKLGVTLVPSAELQAKLSLQLAAGEAPDVSWLTERMFPQFLYSNQLVDISEIKNDPSYNAADQIPSVMDLTSKDGKLYGVPFAYGPRIMYFNKKLFRENGLKDPLQLQKEGKWTYEEMAKAAKAITNPSSGTFGIILFPVADYKDWTNATTDLIWSFGADWFDNKMSKFALNSPEGLKAMQYYYDLLYKDQSHVKPGDQTKFESGKIGMARDTLSYGAKLRTIKDLEWDVAPNPVGVNEKAATVTGMACYVLPNTSSRNYFEAMEVVKFLTGPEVSKELMTSFMPARKSILESDGFLNAVNPPSSAGVKTAIVDVANKGLKIFPLSRNWQKIDTQMRILFDIMYTKSESVENILKRMETEVNSLLK